MSTASCRRLAAVIVGLPLLLSHAAAQEIEDRDGAVVLVAQRADSVTVEVEAAVIPLDGSLQYRWTLTLRPNSAQDLELFATEAPRSDVRSTNGPDGWHISFPSQDRHWERFFPNRDDLAAVSWGAWKAMLEPGQSQGDFSVTTEWLPGPARYWAQGFTPIPEVPFEAVPDSTVGGSLFENSVSDTTLGPVVPPEAADEPGEILDQMEKLLDFSCRRGWIDNRGICTSLEQKLRQVRRSRDRGQMEAARHQLRAFRNELKAQRGKHINESAYSALDLYAKRLSDRL